MRFFLLRWITLCHELCMHDCHLVCNVCVMAYDNLTLLKRNKTNSFNALSARKNRKKLVIKSFVSTIVFSQNAFFDLYENIYLSR